MKILLLPLAALAGVPSLFAQAVSTVPDLPQHQTPGKSVLDAYDHQSYTFGTLVRKLALPRQANRLNTIRLDVMDLTERIDNAVKFVSDSFYALAYRLAASRAGVTEYRDLVEKKLNTAGELYDFMMAQFNEARLFLLEAAITVLCLLDVLLLFRGR